MPSPSRVEPFSIARRGLPTDQTTGTSACVITINGRFLPIPPGEVIAAQAAAEPAPVKELLVPYTPGRPPGELLNPPEGVIVKLLAPADN